MPNQSEPDEVDAYLDKVTAGMDKTPSPEVASQRWTAVYGVPISLDDANQLQASLADTEVGSLMQCVRGTLAETRSEMEYHLRQYIGRLEMDGVPHDQAVSQTFERFGDPKKLGRTIRRDVSALCRKRRSDSRPAKSPFSRIESYLAAIPMMSYGLISAFTPGFRTGGLLEPNALGLVPFALGFASALYSSSRAPSHLYVINVAKVLRNKQSPDATTGQRIKGFLWRAAFGTGVPHILTPGLLLLLLAAVILGSMPVTSVGPRMYFGFACAFSGSFLGNNTWNVFFRRRETAQ